MFRWSTAQPLPSALVKHLEDSGGFRVDWDQRDPAVVLIYLAPHQLLSQGRLPLVAIEMSMTLSLHAARENNVVAIHGERLLQCEREALAQWVPGLPLPCHTNLSPPAPLEAAVTAAILRSRPDLAASYTQLEALAERGCGNADLNYAQQLDAVDAEAMVLAWNDLKTQLALESQQAERMRWSDLKSERQQIATEQTRLRQQLDLRIQGQQIAADLLQRCQNTMTRLLATHRKAGSRASAERTTPPA